MSFLLRAGLVIAVLSYLAAHRDDAFPARAAASSAQAALAVAWKAVPTETQETMAREGAGMLARQVSTALAPSRDTLAEADRRPTWRGAETR